jgi:hypothetical protein
MKCSTCSFDNSDNATTCEKCGDRLSPATPNPTAAPVQNSPGMPGTGAARSSFNDPKLTRVIELVRNAVGGVPVGAYVFGGLYSLSALVCLLFGMSFLASDQGDAMSIFGAIFVIAGLGSVPIAVLLFMGKPVGCTVAQILIIIGLAMGVLNTFLGLANASDSARIFITLLATTIQLGIQITMYVLLGKVKLRLIERTDLLSSLIDLMSPNPRLRLSAVGMVDYALDRKYTPQTTKREFFEYFANDPDAAVAEKARNILSKLV